MVASLVLLTPPVDVPVPVAGVLVPVPAVADCTSAVVAGSGVIGRTAGRAGAETST